MIRKIALVTGVSRQAGIGRAICCALAKNGYDIFFTYWSQYDKMMPWEVSEYEPNLIQQEIIELGVKCEKLEIDLSCTSSIKTIFDDIEKCFGYPCVLINNATYSVNTDIENISTAELDKHYEINVRATTMMCIEFIKRFKGEKNGRIINLTSGQALGAMPNNIAYAITKGAIDTLTKTLFQEIALKRITINSVNPGPNDTGWMNGELKAELLERFPMKRIGKPKDTAKLISFLASEDAEWITGQIIHSEGGFVR